MNSAPLEKLLEDHPEVAGTSGISVIAAAAHDFSEELMIVDNAVIIVVGSLAADDPLRPFLLDAVSAIARRIDFVDHADAASALARCQRMCAGLLNLCVRGTRK